MNHSPTNQPFTFRPAVVTAGAAGGSSASLTAGAATDTLVRDTHREITEIIRDVAVAARSDRTIGQFSSLLVDHILRAMAAEGVVIWHRDCAERDSAFEPIQRSGRVTDRTISPECIATHQAMLVEVAREAIPVVVPATPSASESTVPANPTEVPAAVVPIESDTSSGKIEYLIEVFLEPDGGVTTQRGYLRFVIQMADLAGEFLRAAELRRLKRSTTISQRVDTAVTHLHGSTRREQVQAAIVDTAAELFEFNRVALCIIDTPHTNLVAVSHVNKIDYRSDGARYLLSVADVDLVDRVGQVDNEVENTQTLIVAPTDENSTLRLVAISEHMTSTEDITQLRRFVDHASVSLRNASQFDAIPGGRLLASLAPALQSGQVQWWMRPIFTACVLTMLIIGAMIPVPMYVHSPATIRPADVQRLSAPRDAMVQQLHVQHGDTVFRGDALVTLSDPELERQITQLMGRLAVLSKERATGEKMLMEATWRDQDQGQQSLTEAEIMAIDLELAQLKQIKASLVIRADRSGTVDAWRMQERLDGRPLLRGDPLMRIVATDSPWVVDVLVPQNRIAHVREAIKDETLDVQVALESTPDRRWSAKLQAIGPTAMQNDTGSRANSIRLTMNDAIIGSFLQPESSANRDPTALDSDLASASTSASAISWATDAPAKAMFHCGHRPAAYLLFQDVIAAVRSSAGLYLGTSNE
ncbi:MAG: HlyD family efflux transporter periplasmic adaptor subunit [Pirellulaceae bacterium]